MFKKFFIAALVAVISYGFYCDYQESMAFWFNAMENIKTIANK